MATIVIEDDGERQDISFEEVERGPKWVDQNKWCRLGHEEEDVDEAESRKPSQNEGEQSEQSEQTGTKKVSWKVKHTIKGGGVGMPQLSMQDFVWPTKD